MKKTSFARRKGFSLIELLIVITIIGILAVVFLPKITEGPARARDTQRVADIVDIANAIELYNQDIEAYPTAASWTALTPTALGLGTYFDRGTIPQDPQVANSISGTSTVAGSYAYKQNGAGFIIVADTETDKFTEGYYDGATVTAASPTFVQAVSPTVIGESNIYAYWK